MNAPGTTTNTVQPAGGEWPEVPVDAWTATRDTLHMWTQIVGKVRLELEPMVNHWWQVPLYVNGVGLTTSLMPSGSGGLEITFNFVRHVLTMCSTDGASAEIELRPRSVKDFYAEVCDALEGLGVPVAIYPVPVEVVDAVPFAVDTTHASYDADAVHRFWRSLVSMERVFTQFRAGFVGKASPVHFFWGSFDLAVTRFSGRTAPPHPGGAPNCPTWVMQRAYSHELSSCGYWPGGGGEGLFYSYTYPEPPGFPSHEVAPEAATYNAEMGEFVLPYAAVRRSADPDATLRSFLEATYAAAADLARWDRTSLEMGPEDRPPG